MPPARSPSNSSSPPTRRSASPACAAETASCRSCATISSVEDEHRYEGANPEWPKSTTARPTWSATTTSASSAAAAWPPAARWQGIGVIGPNERGFNTHIACAFEQNLSEVACVSCGQCIVVCPTGAIYEKDQTKEVWRALHDPTKHVVVQTAPCHPRHARRGVRHADRHQRHRKDGRRPAPPGL